MRYQNHIYKLEKTKDGSITLNCSDNTFESNYSSELVNVLIYSPELPSDELANNINSLITKLPLNGAYRVVVDMNEKPKAEPYKEYRVDVVVNGHESSNGLHSDIIKLFKDADYIGPDNLKISYDSLVARIGNKKRRNLEKVISQGAA